MTRNCSALFDLDGTLTRVRSLESSFIAFLIKRKYIGFPQFTRSANYFLKTFWNDPAGSLKRNKMYLKGFSPSEIETLATDFITIHGKNLLYPEGSSLLLDHKAKGHIMILVTGSLEILVRPLVQQLQLPFEYVFSTRLGIAGEKLTGEIDGMHYFGESKRTLAMHLAEEAGFSLKDSYCYADSKSDIPLLALFGNPIAVNPDRYLARAAVSNNWQTKTFACGPAGKTLSQHSPE